MYPLIALASLLFALDAHSAIRFEAEGLRRDFYSFQEACEGMGYHHNLIVTAHPPSRLDCMGREVLVTDFCVKKMRADRPPLLRGTIDPVEEQIVCETGQSVQLTLDCRGQRGRQYCDEPEKGCGELGKIFARKLGLTHGSVVGLGDSTRLNCFYANENKAELDKDLLPMLEFDQ